ncbi:MAG: glucosylglycerol-phosphate synthase [Rhodobacteraceae bacterium]|nr:glucosylglycerol-phosphate synthase [Paracoccaceae bacterium]
MMSKLIIVYHRQPYEEVLVDGKIERREPKSPNGIIPSLKSFFGNGNGGSWVAWTSTENATDDFERVVNITDSIGSYRVSRLQLTPEQVKSFYHVTSKEALWPILHSFKERYNYMPVDWSTFREVNWQFAQAAAAEADDGDIVWVHDYNLWLVPMYLRQLKPNVRIAFFHHTPFPSADMFNVLPWRKEIIESLLACDVVGFHIPRYGANFVGAAQSLLDVDVVEQRLVSEEMMSSGAALNDRRVPVRLSYHGHDITVACAPVGVDVNYIEALAKSDDTARTVAEIRETLGDCRLLLSVSRTDYTKGGAELLQSYERLLAAHPELHGKVRLMHVSVMANSSMAAYEQVQGEIEALAGRISGTYGSFDWQPVSLISTPVPFAELVAYYRAADVAWITPLADGMNLVCEEFVAARTDGDGVLVLSEFAGAAVVLSDAVLTNPFSHRAMDTALLHALDMPEEDRRRRMKNLRAAVAKFGVAHWAETQLASFDDFASSGTDRKLAG